MFFGKIPYDVFDAGFAHRWEHEVEVVDAELAALDAAEAKLIEAAFNNMRTKSAVEELSELLGVQPSVAPEEVEAIPVYRCIPPAGEAMLLPDWRRAHRRWAASASKAAAESMSAKVVVAGEINLPPALPRIAIEAGVAERCGLLVPSVVRDAVLAWEDAADVVVSLTSSAKELHKLRRQMSPALRRCVCSPLYLLLRRLQRVVVCVFIQTLYHLRRVGGYVSH